MSDNFIDEYNIENNNDVETPFMVRRTLLVTTMAETFCRQKRLDPFDTCTRNRCFKRTGAKVFVAHQPLWMAFLPDAIAAVRAMDELELFY